MPHALTPLPIVVPYIVMVTAITVVAMIAVVPLIVMPVVVVMILGKRGCAGQCQSEHRNQ